MISGFVITASAQNRTGLEFAVSRAARLYPAFWAGLIFTIVIAAVWKNRYCELHEFFFNATRLNDYFNINDVDGVY